MSLSRDEVRKVAALARLALSPEEEAQLQTQLSAILDAVRQLEALDTQKVPPTSHANFGATPLRADQERPSLAPEQALANAPAKVGTSFAVPKILE